jgi:hypothetical protein
LYGNRECILNLLCRVLIWSERKKFSAFWQADYFYVVVICVMGVKKVLAWMIVVFEELVMTVVLLQLNLTLA